MQYEAYIISGNGHVQFESFNNYPIKALKKILKDLYTTNLVYLVNAKYNKTHVKQKGEKTWH